jgi:RNA polymerase sigma factor (sigma-70 family)
MGINPMKIFFRKELSFEEIVEGCKQGNRSCQSLLYHKTSGKMFGLCLRYIKDKQTAEDMLQEGYIKLFDHISDFRNEGSFEGWMKRIFVNTCLQELRKGKLNLVLEEEIYDTSAVSEDIITDRYSAQDLQAMVQGLSDGYRTIFNLYAIEGYSHNEISSILGISESTSKSQLSRARTTLKSKIEKQNIAVLSYVK